MLPARLARLEAEAKITGENIHARRELLDWHLNAQKELREHKAAMAAQKGAEEAFAQDSQALPASPAMSTMRSTWSSTTRLPDAQQVAASSTRNPKMVGSASSPVLGQSLRPSTMGVTAASARAPSLLTMGLANPANSMHSRADNALLAAQRNAGKLQEQRTSLDTFKELKEQMAQSKGKSMNLTAMYNAPLPPSTLLKTSGHVQRLSYNSRCQFAHDYSFKSINVAVKDPPPPYPVLPTTSMRSRFEACEHQALWNHQTMSHNQMFLDDYRQFAKG